MSKQTLAARVDRHPGNCRAERIRVYLAWLQRRISPDTAQELLLLATDCPESDIPALGALIWHHVYSRTPAEDAYFDTSAGAWVTTVGKAKYSTVWTPEARRNRCPEVLSPTVRLEPRLQHASAGEGTYVQGIRNGRPIAGDPGTAIAIAQYGRATAGDFGTAIVGQDGIAMVGCAGRAQAGYGGTLIFTYAQDDGQRLRVDVYYVGEDGIEADTLYEYDQDLRAPVKVPA